MMLLLMLYTALVAWSAYNLYHPTYRPANIATLSFLVGLAAGELALHVVFWGMWFVAFLVLFGGVWGPVGALCFVVILLSWATMVRFYVTGYGAGDVMEDALQSALGSQYRDAIKPELAEKLGESIDENALRHPFKLRDPDVDLIKNIPFGNFGQLLDIRRPRGDINNAPVLLQIHGGAWTEKMGSKNEQALPLMNHMAKLGWVCVATSYRLSPTHTFPDHIIDIKECITWIKSHIADYGGRPDFIMLTGGSAGGHLTSLAALTPNDPAFQPGFEDVDTTVQGAVPFYGPKDFSDENGLQFNDGLREVLESSILKRSFSGNETFYRSLSPMHRIHADAPPFLIIHGDSDTLVPVQEGQLFAARLAEVSSAPVAWAEIPDAQHAFDLVPSLRSERVKFGVARFLAWNYSRHLENTG